MQIRSPGNENCLLFEEVQKKNMLGSNGVFAITINDGSRIGGINTGISLERVFQNRGSFTGLSDCGAGSSYTPNPADGRRFAVEFRDENMSNWEPLPTSLINFTPLALEARSVGGFNASHLLRVANGSGVPQDVNPLTPANVVELMNLINGDSTQYLTRTAGAGAMLPSVSGDPASPQAGSMWFDSVANELKYYDGTDVQVVGSGGGGSGTVTSVTAGDGLSGGTFTVSGTISLSDVGTAGTYYKVTTDAKGRVTSGVTSLAETDLPTISTAGKVSGSAITSGTIGGTTSINTSGSIVTSGTLTGDGVSSNSLSARNLYLRDAGSNHIHLQAPASISNYALTLPADAGANGQVLTTDGSGGLSWASVSGSPTGNAGGDLDGTYPNPTLKEIVTADTGTKITYDAKGRVVSSTTLDAADIPDLNWSKITAGKPTTVSGYGITDAVQNAGGIVSIQAGNDTDKPVAGTAGRIYVAFDEKKIYHDDGAMWVEVASVSSGGGGGGGVVDSVTATGPLSSTGGTDPEISISKADGSTDGYLAKEDWDTFNSKLGAVTGSSLSEGQVWVGNGSNQAVAVSPVGDVVMTNTGSFTVTGIRGGSVSATTPTEAGQVLRYDGTSSYVPSFLSLADIRSTTTPFNSMFPDTSCTAAETLNWSSLTDTLTCTSIAIPSTQVTGLGSMATETSSDYLSKSGNLSGIDDAAAARTNLGAMAAVTPGATGDVLQSDGTNWVSGALSVAPSDFASQTANTVLAAPNGSNGTPVFRSLASEDIPNLDAAKINSGTLNADRIPNLNASKIAAGTLPVARGGTGRTSFSNNAVMVTNGSGAPTVGLTCATSGHVMRWSGSAWECAAINQGVTSVATGTGLTGGTITGTGTISLANTAVTTGSYGSANQVATFTVDQQGRLTAAGNTSIGSLNASAVTAGTFGVDRIPTLTAAKIPDLDASKITAGTFGVDRIPTLTAAKIPNLDASKITTGTLGADRIPNLNASKITAGTIATARLGTGTPSSSNFLRGDGSWQAVTGGVSAQTTASCNTSGTTPCTLDCPSGYFRSGCSTTAAGSGTVGSAAPTTNGCTCTRSAGSGSVTCYIYCIK